MLNAVGLTLTALGALGALLAAAQLAGWFLGGERPVIAAAWQHAGASGQLLAGFFAWLPEVVLTALAFHALVAWLGLGLYRRRPWARTGAIAFALAWAATAIGTWVLARWALADYARGAAARAAFVHAVSVLADEVAGASVALGLLLALLLTRPAVRAQFSAGNAGTSKSSADPARRA